MPEKGQLRNTKLELSRVNDNTMLTESLKHCTEVLLMLFRSGAGNKHIIYVCIGMVQPTKDLIDEMLKRLCSISQPKGHSYKFE